MRQSRRLDSASAVGGAPLVPGRQGFACLLGEYFSVSSREPPPPTTTTSRHRPPNRPKQKPEARPVLALKKLSRSLSSGRSLADPPPDVLSPLRSLSASPSGRPALSVPGLKRAPCVVAPGELLCSFSRQRVARVVDRLSSSSLAARFLLASALSLLECLPVRVSTVCACCSCPHLLSVMAGPRRGPLCSLRGLAAPLLGPGLRSLFRCAVMSVPRWRRRACPVLAECSFWFCGRSLSARSRGPSRAPTLWGGLRGPRISSPPARRFARFLLALRASPGRAILARVNARVLLASRRRARSRFHFSPTTTNNLGSDPGCRTLSTEGHGPRTPGPLCVRRCSLLSWASLPRSGGALLAPQRPGPGFPSPSPCSPCSALPAPVLRPSGAAVGPPARPEPSPGLRVSPSYMLFSCCLKASCGVSFCGPST